MKKKAAWRRKDRERNDVVDKKKTGGFLVTHENGKEGAVLQRGETFVAGRRGRNEKSLAGGTQRSERSRPVKPKKQQGQGMRLDVHRGNTSIKNKKKTQKRRTMKSEARTSFSSRTKNQQRLQQAPRWRSIRQTFEAE